MARWYEWNFGTSATETLDSLAAWESEIEEWEQLTGERMADSIKLCVLDSQAPKELSAYLRLHTQAEETFATVKRKIQDYLQAIDQSGPIPMEVGFVGKKGQEGQRQAAQGRRQAGQAAAGQEPTHGTHGEGSGEPSAVEAVLRQLPGILQQLRQVGPPAARVLAKSINNLADSTSASSNSRVDTYNSSGDHGTGAGQGGFAGGIWEHDEDYDDKGWIFSDGEGLG